MGHAANGARSGAFLFMESGVGPGRQCLSKGKGVFVLNDVIRRAASVNPRGAAIIDGDVTLTWPEVLARVQHVAGFLRRHGVRHGDRVAIFSLNGARYYEFMLAVIWVGGIVVPMNTRLAEPELEYCLNDLEDHWIATDDRFVEMLGRLQSRDPGRKGGFYLGCSTVPAGFWSFAEMLAGDPGFAAADPQAGDVAFIYYTGGTTGAAKGVMLTHQQMRHAADLIATALCAGQPFDHTSIYAHVAPMFHMADGVMCIAVPMVAGTNTFVERFDVAALVDHCNRHGVSWLTLVPAMLNMLCDHLITNGLDIPSLQGVFYGAAPMPLPVLRRVMATLPRVRLFQGYGSTEALIISMLEPRYHQLHKNRERLLRSAGRPLHGVLLGVFDSAGRELPVGETGEICVRSECVMKGYWKKPGLTNQVLAGNWLHTGDAGYVDEEGFVFLVDRVRDMVISGGENIYPSDVEQALHTHPGIAECAVVGLPHEKWGEAVHAVICLKPGVSVCGEELDVHCRTQIAGYKVPKSWAIGNAPLPRTPLGKIDKVALRGQRSCLVQFDAA